MQFKTTLTFALAMLVGGASAYGGSFMGSRSQLRSGRAAAGRSNLVMEVSSVVPRSR